MNERFESVVREMMGSGMSARDIKSAVDDVSKKVTDEAVQRVFAQPETEKQEDDPSRLFEDARQGVYAAAMTGALRELDQMTPGRVSSLSQCPGIVGAAAQSLLDYRRGGE